MGFFDSIRAAAFSAPAPAVSEPVRARQAIPVKRRIEAGEVTRLNASWQASNLAADEEIKRNLDKIRARSRDLAYNNEYAGKYLQMVGTHIVGPNGFTLQSLAADGKTPDRLGRDAIELAFWQWGLPGSCEATGRHGFADFTRLVVEAVARDGEALILRQRGADNAWGYSLKLIEIDRLPTQKNDTTKGGNRISMGVEINADGKPVAYWLNLTDNIDTSAHAVTLTRVPAADVLHLYRAKRAEQRRGLPWMHPVMAGLKMLAGYEEAAIVAARVGAAKMGFYTAPDGTADPLADDQVNGEFYQDAEAGAFSVLPPGYDFKAWDPDYPHQGYEAFVKSRLRSIAAGLGVAYHTLANDLADVNYSSARAGTLEERDNWIVLQNWLIDSFLRPIYFDWLTEALKRGAITMPNGSAIPASKIAKWSVHQWQGRRWTWVDPLKDIEASVLAIKSGLQSPQTIAAQQGLDLDDIIDSIARANKLATDAGLAPYAAPEPVAPPPPIDKPDQESDELRSLAMALLARSMEPRSEPAPGITIHNAPPAVHFTQGEVRHEITVQPSPAPNVEVRNDITLPEQPAPNVDVRVEALMPEQPAPQIEVNVELPDELRLAAMPARETTSTIERDAAGNIIKTTQREADAP